MSTVATFVRLPDVLTEGTDGQFVEVDLTDPAGVSIDTSVISGLIGTFRALDTGEALFADTDLLAAPARASYPGTPGRIRVTFTADDMASRVISGRPQELQTRRLTLSVTHSEDQVFHCGVQFLLHNMGDVVTPTSLHHRRLPNMADTPAPTPPTPPTRPTTPVRDPERPAAPDLGRPGRPGIHPEHPDVDPDERPTPEPTEH